MPQMSPLMWLLLMFFFASFYLIYMIILYFEFYLSSNFKLTSFTHKSLSFSFFL